tara:strand:+ start:152705 stop:153205 length:501 start_codon:yes stop_codon:yes gene_type:complete
MIMTKRLRVSLILVLFVGACGGGFQQPKATNTSGSAAESPEMGLQSRSYSDDPREHISQLFGEIGDMRQRTSLAREPLSDDVRSHENAPAPQSTDVEAPAVSVSRTTSVCESTCKVATNICHNAASICKLAPELAETEHAEWADEKCASSKASCTEATKQCDDCDE